MFFFVLGLCVLASSGYVLGECSDGCKEPILFYDGLNCKPLFASPGDCCPSRYDCSHIEAASNEDKCHFNGKLFNLGEGINNDETYGNCQVGCTCDNISGKLGFNCAILDCPEWLGRVPAYPCGFNYVLGKCCAQGDSCPPYNATCEVGGKTYHNGFRFTPPNNVKCTSCVCIEGFEGKFEAPFCKKDKCIEEIHHQQEIRKFCAPTFQSLDDCCPNEWKCPEETDKLVPGSTPSDVKCKYGEQELNIGDKVEKGNLSCECRIPPYLTCLGK